MFLNVLSFVFSKPAVNYPLRMKSYKPGEAFD